MNDNFTIEQFSPQNHHFLKNLQKISSPPEFIFARGLLPKSGVLVAIVGTRKASSYGERTAYDLGYSLAKSGLIVISGLALGIDAKAHQGALDAGGITVAVLANGPDKIYPATNKNLAEKIIESGGCILSEYPPGTPSYPNQFILRNRIISGLSDAVIVVEAPEKSGALATANFAKKQGKPVFAMPGPVSSKNHDGCHQLIRKGAKLITGADDFLSDMGLESKTNKESASNLSAVEKKILKTLEGSGELLSVDKICQITKLNPRDTASVLSSLIIKEIVSEEGGAYRINS